MQLEYPTRPFDGERRGSSPAEQQPKMRLLAQRQPRALQWLVPLLIICSLLLVFIVAHLTRATDSVIHSLARYLFLIPIVAMGYFYGQTPALLVAIGTTGLYGPALVQEIASDGLTAGTIELSSVILLPLLFALLVPGAVEVNERQKKLKTTVKRLGEVIEKSRDLHTLLPLILQECMDLCEAGGGRLSSSGRRARPFTIWRGDRSTSREDSPPLIKMSS